MPYVVYTLGLVAKLVIQAIGRLEFEDDLRTGVLPRGCCCWNAVPKTSFLTINLFGSNSQSLN